MNKFVASAKFAAVADVEAAADRATHVGKRYATYTNDLDIPGYFPDGPSA